MTYEKLKEQTCAGIVLYNPDIQKLQRNLMSLIGQVSEIVLIDNASQNIEEVRNCLYGLDAVTVIRNDENKGIAAALNQILKFAEQKGYQWYISMDQDSCCSDQLLREYAAVLPDPHIAVLCPYVLNNGKETLEEYRKTSRERTTEITEPLECITSGSLNQVEAARRICGYSEKLFIDCVDADYNIRLLALNYKIVRVNSAYMIQYMGEPKEVRLIQMLYRLTKKNVFKRLRYTPVYGEKRIYYISRNTRYCRMKYGKKAGRRMQRDWTFAQGMYYFLTYPITYNRITMVRAMVKGYRDAKRLMENG